MRLTETPASVRRQSEVGQRRNDLASHYPDRPNVVFADYRRVAPCAASRMAEARPVHGLTVVPTNVVH
jgi:hypothetical protein